MTQTLEQQLDALIAEGGLESITLTRLARGDGTGFWAVYVQGDNATGSHCGGEKSSSEALTAALADLNAKRARPVFVPELAALEIAS